MKIGIDCRTMSEPGGAPAGIGHYTHSLVKALLKQYLQDEFVLFVDHHAKDNTSIHELEQHENATIVRFPFSEHKRYLPLVHSHWMVARMLKRHNLDVFHATANILPLGYTGPSVVTIHDLAVFEHPEWFPDKQLLARTVLIPKTVQKASRLIAVSEATRADIQRLLQVPIEKVAVIGEAVDHVIQASEADVQNVLKKYGIEKPYILYVGTIEPRKNIARLLRAFDLLIELHPHLDTMQLVLAGKRGWKHDDVDATLETMRHADRVRELGYVSVEEKAALFSGAITFVFPSLHEGFGLPVLEAQSMGVPVITSDRGGLKEIVAHAVPLIDPEDIDALSEALLQVLSDDQLRAEIAASGREYAQRFSWDTVAQKTYDVYTDIVHPQK